MLRIITGLLTVLLITVCALPSQAVTIIYDFAGTTDVLISSGGNTIPVGTPFSGTFSYNSPQTGAVSSFRGGTQSIFSFNSLTLTINAQTVTEPAGNLVLYNNVTSSPSGVSNGDSLDTFLLGTPVPSSSGSINGITPDFIYLGFVDTSATAFSGPGLPQTLMLSSFTQSFLGFDYGPLGAGNTDTIHPLTALSRSAITPEPSTLALFSSALVLVFVLGYRKRLKTPCRKSALADAI